LLQAARLGEGASGEAVVAAFVGRFGFKLPCSSPLGAEMKKLITIAATAASACGDARRFASVQLQFDSAPIVRMASYQQAAKFLTAADKGVAAGKLRRWAAQFRWRAGASLVASRLAQALEAEVSTFSFCPTHS